MPVTIVDIARAIGKSNQTVSRALQNNPRISLKTRQLIQETARRMGYTPNLAANRLRLGRSRAIAIGISSPESYSSAELAGALHSAIIARGYSAIFSFWKNLAEQKEAMKNIFAWNPEGIITVEPKYLPDNCSIPVVSYLNSDPRFDALIADYKSEIHELCEALLRLGHRNVVWLGRDMLGHLIHQECQPLGIEVKEIVQNEIDSGDSCRIGCELFEQLLGELGRDHLPTAIIAQNDMEAIGIISQMADHGLNCPRDISVIGTSNLQISAYMVPHLATFDRGEPHIIAQKLLDTLFERVAEPDRPPRKIVLPTSLVLRDSLGPARQ